jgi:hypothetical protein
MGGRRARWWVSGLALAATPALLVVGCPDREVIVEVTKGGVEVLTDACLEKCGGCSLHDAGTIPAHASDRIDAKLWLVAQGQDGGDSMGDLMATGACTRLDGGCGLGDAGCVAGEINDALGRMLEKGLTYDGLKDPATQAVLVMTLHSSPDADAEKCTAATLFACAGFGRTGRGDEYDIVCASCNNGNRIVGSRALPCDRGCFFTRCYDYVARLGAGQGGGQP